MYKHLNDEIIIRLADRMSIPADPQNADYQVYLSWVKQGNTAVPADPLPAPEPSRDARLLDTVAKANAGVDSALDASTDFTTGQKAVLKAILKGAFNGLGKAVSGEQP